MSALPFSDAIRQFHRAVSAEHSTTIASEQMNASTVTALKEEMTAILANSAQIARYHYLTNSPCPGSFVESLYPLQEFQLLLLAEGLRRFEKPNHKDRFSQLIEYLTATPTLFAQLLYLALVRPADGSGWGADDRARFVFGTLPAVYHFFLRQADRQNGLRLVAALLELHAFLHGCDFSCAHRFLNDIIFSFFLAMNPVRFFDIAVQPLMPWIMPRALGKKEFRYSKSGALLTRNAYLLQIVQLCEEAFTTMAGAVQLLPPASLELIRGIASVNSGEFPIIYGFIFDGLFLSYIQKYLVSDRPHIITDIVRVMRCYFPQKYFPSRLHAQVEPLMTDSGRASLTAFLSRLIEGDPIPPSPLTEVVQLTGCRTLMTSRDLCLIWQATQDFAEIADQETVGNLRRLLGNFGPPQIIEDDKYIPIATWNFVSTKTKVHLQDTRQFEEVLEALNLLDFSTVHFSTSEDFIDKLLGFASPFLHVTQRLRISFQPDLLLHHMDILNAFRSNRESVHSHGQILSSYLYHALARTADDRYQLNHIRSLYIAGIALPSLFERSPPDFGYRATDLPPDPRVIIRLRKSISAYLSSLGLSPSGFSAVSAAFYAEFVDRIGAAVLELDCSALEHLSGRFAAFCTANRDFAAGAGEAQLTLISDAALLLQRIGGGGSVCGSLRVIAAVLGRLKRSPDLGVALAIAMSGNIDLVAIGRFLEDILFPYAELICCVLPEDDLVLFPRFIRLVSSFSQ
jgi:hypothetical protein